MAISPIPNIRIGNDLPISFFVTINDGGTELTNANTTILLFDPHGNQVNIVWSISGNQVAGTFLGTEQRHTGLYTLKVILNKGDSGMATSDRKLFRLVAHTWEGDTDPGSLEDFEMTLTDVLSVAEMEALRTLLETGFPEVEERVEDLEGRASDLEGRATELEGRAASLEGRATSLEGRATSLEGRATSLEGRVTAIEENVATAEETEAALEEVFGEEDLG